MGLDRKLRFDPARTPEWPALVARCKSLGIDVAMRMIDGELALPDEMPSPTWREVRVAVAGDMITLRREPDGIALVVWGNAGDAMLERRDRLAEAIVALTGGTIDAAE